MIRLCLLLKSLTTRQYRTSSVTMIPQHKKMKNKIHM